jgi:hypothetical protein
LFSTSAFFSAASLCTLCLAFFLAFLTAFFSAKAFAFSAKSLGSLS